MLNEDQPNFKMTRHRMIPGSTDEFLDHREGWARLAPEQFKSGNPDPTPCRSRNDLRAARPLRMILIGFAPLGINTVMARIFDHVDLRVTSLSVTGPFYRSLLPVLGFSMRVDLEGWLQFEAVGDGPSEFFGVTEDSLHQPNSNRIAFWAESIEKVDELSELLPAMGGVKIEGPGFESDYYYAVYFDDPCGNRLEVCHRLRRFVNV